MMRSLKKFIAVACSLAVVASSGMTAFAAGPETTAGTANVLAYSTESVIVPTTVKVALNPAGYTVTIRDSGTTTTQDQIVTFNYGIANKSTANKVVKVQLRVTGNANAEKTPITFVETAAEAAAYDADSNANGAKAGELKMYLALVASGAAPKTLSGDAFAVETVASGANTENATAANLSDVDMTPATSGSVAFAKDETYYAFAETAFSLKKATYDVQDDKTIDFTTTQEQLAASMEITGLGDVTGFTLVGAMNPDADWTKADVSTLSFAPVYSVTDATGEEVAAGGYKQVKTTPAPYIVTYNANFGETPATATESVAADAHPTGTSEDIDALKTGNEGYTFAGWGTANDSTTAVDLDEISAATTLYAIWEAEAPATYALQLMSATGNLKYTFDAASKPAGSLEAVSINGTDRPAQVTNGNVAYDASNGAFVVKAAAVTNFSLTEGNTTIVATIGGEDYTFTY